MAIKFPPWADKTMPQEDVDSYVEPFHYHCYSYASFSLVLPSPPHDDDDDDNDDDDDDVGTYHLP